MWSDTFRKSATSPGSPRHVHLGRELELLNESCYAQHHKSHKASEPSWTFMTASHSLLSRFGLPVSDVKETTIKKAMGSCWWHRENVWSLQQIPGCIRAFTWLSYSVGHRAVRIQNAPPWTPSGLQSPRYLWRSLSFNEISVKSCERNFPSFQLELRESPLSVDFEILF